MPKIRVPKQRRSGLVLLARTTDKAVNELIDHLSKYPLCIFDPDLISELLQGLKLLDYEDALEITDAVVTMFPALTLTNNSANDFAKKIADAINIGVSSESLLSEKETKKLISRISKILHIKNLATSSKAASVYFENERNLGSTRIITDIRPVFDQITDEIGGAVVLHTLKIEYLNNGDQHEFFVALDDADLDDLIDKLNRAKHKSSEAKKLLNASGVHYIENKT